jgi:hypothetical protein
VLYFGTAHLQNFFPVSWIMPVQCTVMVWPLAGVFPDPSLVICLVSKRGGPRHLLVDAVGNLHHDGNGK